MWNLLTARVMRKAMTTSYYLNSNSNRLFLDMIYMAGNDC